MAKSIDVKVSTTKLDARINKYVEGAVEACAQAVHDAMLVAFRQSQREVPVRTGVLKNSGQVSDPVILDPGHAQVAITYGGSASQYAQVQHDNVTLNHPGGGKAHFVIDPVRDAVPDLKKRLKEALVKLVKE